MRHILNISFFTKQLPDNEVSVPRNSFQAKDQLMDEIESFEAPDEARIDSVNVLLVGEVSAGKSSFFNSVDSVFKGRVMTKAHTGEGNQWTAASLTTQVTFVK